jgi:FkbM family methyltransferase
MATNILNKVTTRALRPWRESRLRRYLDPDHSKLLRFGTDHGGWTIPAWAAMAGGLAVCVGAGEDISFDVELNKAGFSVFTLDPTPRAKEHVKAVLQAADGGPALSINESPTEVYALQGFAKNRFTFAEVGLWEESRTMRFYAPKNRAHVSHSIVNLQHTDEWFEAKCETLAAFCNSHQIEKIDILKLDVEGSEYAILGNILENGPLPGVLCVEFDEIRNPLDGGLMDRIEKIIDDMQAAGYKLRHIDDSNTLFTR